MKITDINKPCSDKEDFIIEISMKIDDHDYIEFGRHLHFSESELRSITQDKTCDRKQTIQVLSLWRKKMAKNATYLALIRACLKTKFQDVAECVMKYAKNASAKPDEGETSQLFPEKCYPNWKEMPQFEKENVINKLRDEHKLVKEAFASFVVNLSGSFSERGVDPKDLQLFLQAYTSCKPPFEFKKNDTVKDVFIAISKRSTWFNDDLFEVVVNKFGTEAEKGSLQEYRTITLIPYLKRSIFQISSKSFSSCDSQSERITIFLKVFEKITLTGIELKAIVCNLANMLKINRSIFNFDHFKEGWFELFFTVNKEVFNPQESVFLEWAPSKKAFRITADLVTIL